ncbi:MAG: nucleoside deaminase [Candidatus Woesearchaeota archaeon]
MKHAIKEAKRGLKEGGEPIGSVLVLNEKIIGRGHNMRIQDGNPIAHAEMMAIKNAGRLSAKEYKQCTLYTTLSPCDMCTGATLLYKIPTIVTGENENFKGPETYLKKRGINLINLNLKECKSIMSKYIQENKTIWLEDIGE